MADSPQQMAGVATSGLELSTNNAAVMAANKCLQFVPGLRSSTRRAFGTRLKQALAVFKKFIKIMQIILNEKPSDEEISEIREGLRDFNRPFLEGVRDDDVVCYLNSKTGEKIAGVVGRIRGKWLSVEYLWVDEREKGKGLGSELLLKLESHAMEQGCHSSMLQTASFQAKPFYRKHGYKTQMILDDFFDNAEVYYMIKRLENS